MWGLDDLLRSLAELERDGLLRAVVTQNIDALLRHCEGAPPLGILDFGCGPGRDLVTFRALGHEAIGLDGALARFFYEQPDRQARVRAGSAAFTLLGVHLSAPTSKRRAESRNIELRELAARLEGGEMRVVLQPVPSSCDA